MGLASEQLLGQPFSAIVTDSTIEHLANALAPETGETGNPFPVSLAGRQGSEQPGPAPTFMASVHRVNGMLIVEMEPIATPENFQVTQFYGHLNHILAAIRRAPTLADLLQQGATAVRNLTHFDRVMVYRFDHDYSGVVVAESLRPGLESYLGLHYPAVDIPPKARELFTKRWLRLIPDVNYQPVGLVSLDAVSESTAGQTEAPLDLSQSELRGVSPCHLEYLRNMGVAASMTIPLIDQNQLWGLMACHHYMPKLAEYEVRRICELVGQLMSVELLLRQERELQSYREQIRQIEEDFRRQLAHSPSQIKTVLKRSQDILLDLIRAQGVAIVLDQVIVLGGQTSDQRVRNLNVRLRRPTPIPIRAAAKV
ncbi:GAF domain-containing protein [Leptolyngbya sp. 7M]|nr:GAF domain-containing protein [Leptolyngbya sp. 7M]